MGKINETTDLSRHKIYRGHICRNVVLLIFGFICFTSHAQTISGTVTNDKQELINGAIINIYNEATGESSGYTMTDDGGKFSVPLQKAKYRLEIRSMGFEILTYTFSAEGDMTRNYVLKKSNIQEIKEVIITATAPIKIMSDTVEFNAKSFKNGTERSVEDLLKKLPGITVDASGKIKIRGKEIEKVMVENDDFFEKGYTLLTKNMSDKPIDKIQILDNYSNNKFLNGIEKSDKVVINLILDKNVRAKWFGEIGAAGAIYPTSYHSEKFSLSKFSKNYKLFFIGNDNSVGRDNTGDIQNLLSPSDYNEPGYIDINDNLYTYNSDFNMLLAIDMERYRLNNDQIISNNAILRLRDDMKLKIINISNFEKIFSDFSSTTSYNLNDVNFSTLEQQKSQFKKHMFFNKIEYNYDISKKNSLKIATNYSLWDSNSKNELQLNDDTSNNMAHTKSYLWDTHLLHTYKLNKASVWLVGFRHLEQSVYNDAKTDQLYFDDVLNFQANPDLLLQKSYNKMSFTGLTSQFIFRNARGGIWDYSIQYSNSHQDFYNLSNVLLDGEIMDLPAEYANNFQNRSDDLRFRTGYKFALNRINFDIKLDTDYYKYNSNNYSQSNWFMNPNLNINFYPHNKGNLFFSVNFKNKRNELIDILPNYFISAPRNLKRGLENEVFSRKLGGSMRYDYGLYTDKFSGSFYFSINSDLHSPSRSYEINPLYTTESVTYLNNKQSIYYSAELNYYISYIKSNLKINYFQSRSGYLERINNIETPIQNKSTGISADIQSGWKRNINYMMGGTVRIRNISSLRSNSATNYEAYLKLSYRYSKKAFLQIAHKLYSFEMQSDSRTYFNFLDTRFSYDYTDRLQFSILGNNLFNVKNFGQSFINNYSSYQSATRIFPRSIMLEVILSLGN